MGDAAHHILQLSSFVRYSEGNITGRGPRRNRRRQSRKGLSAADHASQLPRLAATSSVMRQRENGIGSPRFRRQLPVRQDRRQSPEGELHEAAGRPWHRSGGRNAPAPSLLSKAFHGVALRWQRFQQSLVDKHLEMALHADCQSLITAPSSMLRSKPASVRLAEVMNTASSSKTTAFA